VSPHELAEARRQLLAVLYEVYYSVMASLVLQVELGLDWSCTDPQCDEALPSEDGPEVGNPACPRCGAVMVPAPYCIAVPR